jgi:tetratricopeptide (TPR) repeat protein
LALNDPQRAYASARRAVQADPKLLAAHGLTGRALAMQDRMAEAALELEKAAPADRDGTLHYQMFLAYRKLQQPEKAQAALRKSNELRSRQRSEE